MVHTWVPRDTATKKTRVLSALELQAIKLSSHWDTLSHTHSHTYHQLLHEWDSLENMKLKSCLSLKVTYL